MEQTDVDPKILRRACASFATGVTVALARAPSGRIAGVTANSFTSVSLDPPLVLWSISNTAPSRAVFDEACGFSINVLSGDQRYLSDRFAGRTGDKFSNLPLKRSLLDIPLLPEAIASFVCLRHETVAAGDHHILIGRVLHVEEHIAGDALVFFGGEYRRLFTAG